MRIAIAGSRGFIGSALVKHLTSEGHKVFRYVRPKDDASWKLYDSDFALEVEDRDIDAIVNLCGRSIGARRWTKKEKALLLSSRIDTTNAMVERTLQSNNRVATLVNASAIGYYGNRPDEVVTESSSPGSGFLASIVRSWEAAAQKASDKGPRVINLRTGHVIGNGGLVKKMSPLFKLGLGGTIGGGNQFVSWISIDDEIRAITHVITDKSLTGAINLVSPSPVTNKEFTVALAKTLHRPAIFPVPNIALSAVLGRELATEITGSQNVKPEKLNKSGFKFRHTQIADALKLVNG